MSRYYRKITPVLISAKGLVDGIEVPSNGNIIKTKPGSRSKGRENRTKTIRKKITGAMKRKKPDFQDEDWI